MYAGLKRLLNFWCCSFCKPTTALTIDIFLTVMFIQSFLITQATWFALLAWAKLKGILSKFVASHYQWALWVRNIWPCTAYFTLHDTVCFVHCQPRKLFQPFFGWNTRLHFFASYSLLYSTPFAFRFVLPRVQTVSQDFVTNLCINYNQSYLELWSTI